MIIYEGSRDVRDCRQPVNSSKRHRSIVACLFTHHHPRGQCALCHHASSPPPQPPSLYYTVPHRLISCPTIILPPTLAPGGLHHIASRRSPCCVEVKLYVLSLTRPRQYLFDELHYAGLHEYSCVLYCTVCLYVLTSGILYPCTSRTALPASSASMSIYSQSLAGLGKIIQQCSAVRCGAATSTVCYAVVYCGAELSRNPDTTAYVSLAPTAALLFRNPHPRRHCV